MIKAIFAVDEAGAIGHENGLPWPHNKTDLKHFSDITMGHVVAMGRNTWNSLPEQYKPLSGRENAIITRDCHLDAEGQINRLADWYKTRDIFIIGGKQLLEATIHMVNYMYITEIQGMYQADTYLDTRNLVQGFKQVNKYHNQSCTFEEYQRETIPKGSTNDT